MDTIHVLKEIGNEVIRAESCFPEFASAHEGYAVILEEIDELWHEVKNNKDPSCKERMHTEAIQIAAMAVRFIKMLNHDLKA